MATGDIRGNLHRLQSELKHARYPKDIDYSSLARGSPADFLPILHYVMCDFSRPLSELILDSNIDMVGKSDRKFLEATYKALRDLFSYKPCITAQQFFSKGFAERKILLMIDVVAMVRKKHKSLSAKKGPSASQSRLGQGDASKSGRKPPSPGAASLPQLSEISAPEEFRPSLNSTTSECLPSTPTTPTTQTTAPTENGPSVEIVVVGHTPAPPNVKVVKQSSPDQTTQSTATYRAVIHDDELKTHPVIRDLAVVVGDLMNRVQTLEEQVTRLTVSTKKEEQRGNARWVLLENNFNILEGQLANKGLLNTKPPESQQTFQKDYHNQVVTHNGRNGSNGRPSSSSSSSGEEGMGHSLETLEEEEEEEERDASGALVIDEKAGGLSSGEENGMPQDRVEEDESDLVAKDNSDLQAQADRIQEMMADAQIRLQINSSLTADA